MMTRVSAVAVLLLLATGSAAVDTDETWLRSGADGHPQIQLYFFWTLTCPHCTEARPHIRAMAEARPWLRLHDLELTRSAQNAALYRALAERLGEEARSVPALLLCGEMHVGWGSDETTGALIRQRLDDCRAGAMGDGPGAGAGVPAGVFEVPLFGTIHQGDLSLPVLTLVLAGLDAFNPCAFFVLLFLLSMLVHQRNRGRMAVVGGVFVAVSGLMYFAFMAAWLNVFHVFGHLQGVTVAAGALAVLVGVLNVKDFFLFGRGPTLSIPEARKPTIFRRARTILSAENLPAMVGATVLLAVAANFYELLCTAGFPMVFTRLLTLADLSVAARYGYLAAYNVIYVLPLALIVLLFVRSLGARKLTERKGRLLKLLSGVMMLGLGTLLLVAPEAISRVGIALGLMAMAIAVTWIAARLTRAGSP